NEVRSWFSEPINNESSSDYPFQLGFAGLKKLSSIDIGDSIQELICNIYSRTEIYMQASSLYRLSLLADSFRTELVREINRDLHTRFSGLVDRLIAHVEVPEAERTKLLNAQYSYEEFDVVVPS